MVSPMCQYSADDGSANDWHFTHINNLALSGAAMFCIEATHVEAIGRITQGCLGLYSDANEAALKPILASRAKTFESGGGDAARACRPQGLQRAALGGRPADSARRARRLAGGGAVGCRRTRRARPRRPRSTMPALRASATPSSRPPSAPSGSASTRWSCTARTVTSCINSCRRSPTSAPTNMAAASRTGCAIRSKSMTPCARPSRATSRSACACPRPTGWTAAGTCRRPSRSPTS